MTSPSSSRCGTLTIATTFRRALTFPSLSAQALGVAYNARIVRWADFRDQISSRAKLQFLFHLANRGYTGKLTFDHDKNNLYVRVQTDEGKKKLTKDSKSLSGGEKTFSTICLLLTMWEAVGCPLRCLDEFVSRFLVVSWPLRAFTHSIHPPQDVFMVRLSPSTPRPLHR